jgi:hypothetical protein
MGECALYLWRALSEYDLTKGDLEILKPKVLEKLSFE